MMDKRDWFGLLVLFMFTSSGLIIGFTIGMFTFYILTPSYWEGYLEGYEVCQLGVECLKGGI